MGTLIVLIIIPVCTRLLVLLPSIKISLSFSDPTSLLSKSFLGLLVSLLPLVCPSTEASTCLKA